MVLLYSLNSLAICLFFIYLPACVSQHQSLKISTMKNDTLLEFDLVYYDKENDSYKSSYELKLILENFCMGHLIPRFECNNIFVQVYHVIDKLSFGETKFLEQDISHESLSQVTDTMCKIGRPLIYCSYKHILNQDQFLFMLFFSIGRLVRIPGC